MPSSEIWSAEVGPELWQSQSRPAGTYTAFNFGRIFGGNKPLWYIPLFFSILGVVMIASVTMGRPGTPYDEALKQLRYVGAGLFVMCVCYLISISFLRRWSWLIWLVAMVLTGAILVPGIGVTAGGASRWVKLGPITLQPLEVLTVALPIFLADRLTRSKREKAKGFFRPTLLLAAISIFFIRQHMGGILLVCSICLSMHWISKGLKYPILTALVLALVFYFILIPMAEYRKDRYAIFANPWSDSQGKGYQIIQGLVAFSNGSITGMGIGKGLQKSKFLPAAKTDYIFSAIGEELGLAGTLLVVGFYGIWTFKAFRLYQKSDDPYTALLIWGMTASILFPMFINLGGVMHLMPLTGIPLPFLSAGGSSMICTWAKVGILMRAGKEISGSSAG